MPVCSGFVARLVLPLLMLLHLDSALVCQAGPRMVKVPASSKAVVELEWPSIIESIEGVWRTDAAMECDFRGSVGVHYTSDPYPTLPFGALVSTVSEHPLLPPVRVAPGDVLSVGTTTFVCNDGNLGDNGGYLTLRLRIRSLDIVADHIRSDLASVERDREASREYARFLGLRLNDPPALDAYRRLGDPYYIPSEASILADKNLASFWAQRWSAMRRAARVYGALSTHFRLPGDEVGVYSVSVHRRVASGLSRTDSTLMNDLVKFTEDLREYHASSSSRDILRKLEGIERRVEGALGMNCWSPIDASALPCFDACYTFQTVNIAEQKDVADAALEAYARAHNACAKAVSDVGICGSAMQPVDFDRKDPIALHLRVRPIEIMDGSKLRVFRGADQGDYNASLGFEVIIARSNLPGQQFAWRITPILLVRSLRGKSSFPDLGEIKDLDQLFRKLSDSIQHAIETN